MIACPVPQATPAALPHAPPPGLPINPPGAPTVLIGGPPGARVGDQSLCIAPAPTPNAILRGAFPVLVGGKPAARMTDSGTHPGSMISPPCCPTVLIGLAGTSGNPWAGKAACQAAKSGRSPPPGAVDPAGNQLAPNTPGQSYNNCGVESSRQIINQTTGANVGQETLLNQSMAAGNATQIPGNLYASGGTTAAQRVSVLGANGVPAATVPATMQNLEVAVSEGRGVISAVDAGVLWPAGTAPLGSGHAILVTGVEYDDAGNIKNVIINDTGMGTCAQPVPVATFQSALTARGGVPHVVTNNPIW
jgi:uncharacterized Zn-binding protein involved in type VI secretion